MMATAPDQQTVVTFEVTSSSSIRLANKYNDYPVVITVLDTIVGLLIIMSNSLTLAAIHMSKDLLGKKGKIYIQSLTLADFLLGPSFVLNRILCLAQVSCPNYDKADMSTAAENIRVCYVIIGLVYIQSIASSLFTLVAMAIDRVMAIAKPIFYKNEITIPRLRVVIACIWVYVSVLMVTLFAKYAWQVPQQEMFYIASSLELLPPWVVQYLIRGQVYLSLLANLVLYTCTFFLLRRRQRQFKQAKQETNSTGKNQSQSVRFTRMAIVTVGVLFLLWIPDSLLGVLFDGTDPATPAYIRYYVKPVASLMLYSNAWVNPAIYWWMNKDYRRAYARVFAKCTCCYGTKVVPINTNSTNVEDSNV